MMKINFIFLNMIFFLISSTAFAEKNQCQYKVIFDDKIPGNISYLKLKNNQKFKKFEVKPYYSETTIQDCIFKNNQYYVLSSSISSTSFNQIILAINTYDSFGELRNIQFINKKWTCEIDKGFYIKNNQLKINYSCAAKPQNELENLKFEKYTLEIK